METAKYNTKSIDESNQLQSQETLTAVIISTASLNKNTKIEKLSHDSYITQNHQHHLVTLNVIH